MLAKLRHAWHVARSVLREHNKLVGRSPQWPSLEKKIREAHPMCEACDSSAHIQVHHRKPFHLHPELELEPSNLICLCMGPNECHLRLGHGDNFKAYNPNVDADATESLKSPLNRPAIWSRAKASRLFE